MAGYLAALAVSPAFATDQALLDALVRKGILTDKEAQQIEEEVSKEPVAPAPGTESKIKLGDWVQELRLYGDIRLRGQYDTEQPQIPAAPRQTNYPNVSQRWRWRFRLRLNADVQLAGGWFAGFGLQTNNAADSANQTFTQGFDNYNIYINKAFIGYSPVEGITAIAGKQANPFYTTDLFWDPDIFPQGLVERIDFHKLFDLSFGEPGYSKEGKAPVAPPPEGPRNALELSLIAGQLIFFDNNEFNQVTGATGNIKNDAYEFETQLLARLKLGKNFSFTVAPAVFITNDAEVGSAGNPAIALNNTGAFNGNQRDELILLAPGDISFKIGKLPVKLYWDFAYNTNGNDRWNDVYGPLFSDVTFNAARTAVTGFPASSRISPSFSDNLAWLVGIQFGQNKKQGDLSIFGNFRQIGLTSIDPNINDSDFAVSNLNMQGFKFGLAYNVTDYAVFAVTGYITWNLTQNLYGGAANSPSNITGAGIAHDTTADTLQVDLNVQF
ncbi:MAG: putative porin [Verrucomicrobia bacterium]|nr:putative porin [Verrucomicrobiota bacterium]